MDKHAAFWAGIAMLFFIGVTYFAGIVFAYELGAVFIVIAVMAAFFHEHYSISITANGV